MALTREDVYAAEKEISEAAVLLTQRETHPDSIEAFLELGKKYGKPVVVNPAPALPIPDAWYPMIDTITPNETEAEKYTGITVTDEKTALDAAMVFASWGVRRVIITRGRHGVFCAEFDADKKPIFKANIATMRVDAVDTTGAGDSFNGALCTALAEGRTLVDACRFATVAASLSVTRPGAAESMATREEIDALYNKFYHSGIKIDARARMLAMENEIFWRSLEGTGEDGMITESDVRRAMKHH